MLWYVFSRFHNSITSARNNIFSYRKKFLVAAIPFYKKQKVKIDLGPPGPLKEFNPVPSIHDEKPNPILIK